MSFEWNRGNETLIDGPTGNGSVISGSSTPVLTIIGVSVGDAGNYSCGVFSVCGSDVSPSATLDVTQCPTCPGDLDSDADVDLADLARLLGHFGDPEAPPSDGDIDGDGDVDLSDLAQLLGRFGTVC
ncbi:MAG: immunoglobulin domain-containing protein [Phycisphaerales bacterium]|nr:immunoglobulin domain-containing protein [Phycisphaerales bacterium]